MTAMHVDDLLEGHLLGALELREAAEVASHLGACEECADKLRAAREVLAVLPISLEPEEPSPALKSRLMAALDADAEPTPIASRRQVPEQRRDVWRQVSTLAAAVFAAVAVGAIAWALVLQNDLDQREQELDAARIAAGAFARSAETLHMESDFSGGPVEAAIAVPREGTNITVVVTGLPDLPEGEAYRLWLFADGDPQAGVPLAPDSNGNVVAQLDVDLSQFDAMELDAQSVDASAPGGRLVIGGPLR